MKDPPPQRRGGDARPQKSGEKRGRMRKSSPPPTTPSFPPSVYVNQLSASDVRIERRESGVSEFTFHILRGCVYVYKPQEKTLSRGGKKRKKSVCLLVFPTRSFSFLAHKYSAPFVCFRRGKRIRKKKMLFRLPKEEVEESLS